MQPHPMTSVMQLTVTAEALAVAASAISFTVWTWREHRNADLVQIGVNVLRADPEKEKQISASREWALSLIDANAGGVKFSPEARARLLREPLGYFADYSQPIDYSTPIGTPDKPVPRRPAPEPPK
jgi:hypothetical protein